MQPYEMARETIVKNLKLSLTLEEIRMLERTLRWLFNRGEAKAITELEKG